MRPIVTLISLAAFVLHFALGCCAHHAHAADAMAGHDGITAHAHDGHNHPHGPARSSEAPRQDQRHNDGHQGHCFVTPGAKSIVGKDLLSGCWHVSGVAGEAGVIDLRSAVLDERCTPLLPVRLHLWHQVFLN